MITSCEGLLIDSSVLEAGEALWFCTLSDAQYRRHNAVCATGDFSFEALEDNRAFFEQFTCVFVAIPNKAVRDSAAECLSRALRHIPVYKLADGALKGCDSLAKFIGDYGWGASEQLLVDGEQVPAFGLLDIADVKTPDLSAMKKTTSCIWHLDKLLGGFREGELTVWTGKRGSGKSTLVGQVLLRSIDQGMKVCAYSGELPDFQFKNWLTAQAAGRENLQAQTDRDTGREYFIATPWMQVEIDKWWGRKLWLYDSRQLKDSHYEDDILDMFFLAKMQYGCSVFLVDNLMTAQLSMRSDKDYYQAQGRFVGRLSDFAKKHRVHVHLVAHPRKTSNRLDADDISGSGDTANKADNVLALTRLDEMDAAERGCDSILSILKNRHYGQYADIGLRFEPSSRRFCGNGGNHDWRFGWEMTEQGELKPHVKVPFEGGNL